MADDSRRQHKSERPRALRAELFGAAGARRAHRCRQLAAEKQVHPGAVVGKFHLDWSVDHVIPYWPPFEQMVDLVRWLAESDFPSIGSDIFDSDLHRTQHLVPARLQAKATSIIALSQVAANMARPPIRRRAVPAIDQPFCAAAILKPSRGQSSLSLHDSHRGLRAMQTRRPCRINRIENRVHCV